VFQLASIHVFATVPNPVPRADSVSISSRSRDIGQVPSRNFDWLPFNPPLVAFSGPSDIVRMIEGMGQHVGWNQHPHAMSVHEEEKI
jgi:hypothetical protein